MAKTLMLNVTAIFVAGAALNLMAEFGVTEKVAKFITKGYGV